MAARKTTSEDNASTMPIACALTPADLAAQAARWEKFAARAMTGRTETEDGLRICFGREPGAEDELRELAAVESQCCPWAVWTVQTSPQQIVLAVRSAGEGIAALHSMFTHLQSAPAHCGD